MNLSNIIDLFRKGSAVANPAAWKNNTNKINSLATLLTVGLAVANSLGYPITIDPVTLTKISGLIVGGLGLLNTVATTVSSDKVGILPTKKK